MIIMMVAVMMMIIIRAKAPAPGLVGHCGEETNLAPARNRTLVIQPTAHCYTD
jgi:hypothetical protein